ncbi:hypothetical protein [Streptomyces sp. NPDC093589]|uniref:hypothetical protein n=1 Tax=Streptomyces sp. NPDC093589 TaxID=3366043 RepID=UPI003810AB82
MRKDDGAPGISLIRLFRVPLTALAVILAFLLGGASTLPDAAAAAAQSSPGSAALRPVGPSPAVNATYKKTKDTSEREAERGQHRRTSRTTVGVPQHPGRLLPPCRSDVTTPMPAALPGAYSAGESTTSVARPERIPLLHCVFRC